MSELYVVPVSLREANEFVSRFHRHHAPSKGHRFSLGAVDEDGVLHGVVIVGRPVARLAGHPRDVAEVSRLASDGTANVCSLLYGAAARACKEMGFRRIQTYILPTELGSSLRAAGWTREGKADRAGQWQHTDGFARRTDQPTERKIRWARALKDRPVIDVTVPLTPDGEGQLALGGTA